MGGDRPRLLHAVLLLPALLIGAWIATRARTTRDDPAAVLTALRAAAGPSLPAAAAVGATSRSDPESFNRDTLYEFNDGAAESYLAHGFETCATANYRFGRDAAALEVMAEVHRFASPDGAAAQMRSEAPGAGTPVTGVAGATADASTLVATRGRDFLKLTALGTGEGVRDTLVKVAAAWGGPPR